MTQSRLVDFGGEFSKLREDHKRILEALRHAQETGAFYQADSGRLRRAVQVLKNELSRQHQSLHYRDNEGRYAELRRKLYVFFRDVIHPTWNPEQEPDGVYYKRTVIAFVAKYPFARRFGDSTLRRRLNELADERICQPPPLQWIRPGYYFLRSLENQNSSSR